MYVYVYVWDSLLRGRYCSPQAKAALKCSSLLTAKWMFVQGESPIIYVVTV